MPHTNLTEDDLQKIATITKTVFEAAAPTLMKVAAAISGNRVEMVGDLFTSTPVPGVPTLTDREILDEAVAARLATPADDEHYCAVQEDNDISDELLDFARRVIAAQQMKEST